MLPIQIRRRQARVQGQSDPWVTTSTSAPSSGINPSNTSQGANLLRFMTALARGSK